MPLTRAQAILGSAGLSFVGGLLEGGDGSSYTSKPYKIQTKTQERLGRLSAKTAGLTGRYTYGGQRQLASEVLAPYLAENLNVGLTDEEKELYRATGKTEILQSVRGMTGEVKKAAASQGLRGGRVADVVAGVSEAAIPAFADLETDIMMADIERKRMRVQEILAFLGLTSGYEEGLGLSDEDIREIMKTEDELEKKNKTSTSSRVAGGGSVSRRRGNPGQIQRLLSESGGNL